VGLSGGGVRVGRISWRSLVPDEYFQSIYDVDLDALSRRGITGLILDLDNTLAAWRFGEPEARLSEWMNGVKSRGFSPFIVSNDLGPRVALFTKFLGVPGLARAGKPRQGAFRSAVRRLGCSPEAVAVIGDQIFTDIFGAKPVGCHTILVVPVSRREFAGTRLVRVVERCLLRLLIARGHLTGPVRRSLTPGGAMPAGDTAGR
jgi:HAD superfamily phosphatase (TIGR01668 family)